MFNPEEASQSADRFALHIVHRHGVVNIEKIPLLKIATRDTRFTDNDAFVEPMGDHHAYLINDMLKLSTEFPLTINVNLHIRDNNRKYNETMNYIAYTEWDFQMVPLYYRTVSTLFSTTKEVEYLLYHPTWEKRYLDSMLRQYPGVIMRSVYEYMENVEFQ